MTENIFLVYYHYKIYDYFGLDDEDIKSRKFQALAGFRAWYILQRYDGLYGAYRPFITKMEFDVPFSGNVCVIK